MYKNIKSEHKNKPNVTEETWLSSYREPGSGENWEIMENTENNNAKLSPSKSFKTFKYVMISHEPLLLDSNLQNWFFLKTLFIRLSQQVYKKYRGQKNS